MTRVRPIDSPAARCGGESAWKIIGARARHCHSVETSSDRRRAAHAAASGADRSVGTRCTPRFVLLSRRLLQPDVHGNLCLRSLRGDAERREVVRETSVSPFGLFFGLRAVRQRIPTATLAAYVNKRPGNNRWLDEISRIATVSRGQPPEQAAMQTLRDGSQATAPHPRLADAVAVDVETVRRWLAPETQVRTAPTPERRSRSGRPRAAGSPPTPSTCRARRARARWARGTADDAAAAAGAARAALAAVRRAGERRGDRPARPVCRAHRRSPIRSRLARGHDLFTSRVGGDRWEQHQGVAR